MRINQKHPSTAQPYVQVCAASFLKASNPSFFAAMARAARLGAGRDWRAGIDVTQMLIRKVPVLPSEVRGLY